MTVDRDPNVASEVAQRLDDLFAEDAPAADPPSTSVSARDLTDLYAIVLSIEWEITDEIMQSFIAEIERLQTVFAHDRIVVSLLQLLGAVARYIESRKATAHPDAIKLLNTAYRSLEAAVAPGAEESAKKALFDEALSRFKALKAKIRPAAPTPPTRPTAPPAPPPTAAPPKDDTATVLNAIAALEGAIREEFAALRQELAALRHRDG